MIYQFKTHFAASGKVDAQAAGVELERIRVSHGGRLHPEDVVKEAASDTSPIHRAFTWDDKTAADQYRLVEARELIRFLVVIRDDNTEPQRAYWNVTVTNAEETGGDRYYQSSVVVAKNPIEYASALNLMRQELAGAEKGLQQLMTLAPKSERHRVKAATQHITKAQQALNP